MNKADKFKKKKEERSPDKNIKTSDKTKIIIKEYLKKLLISFFKKINKAKNSGNNLEI